jgi:PAS domain S-box-containing protein
MNKKYAELLIPLILVGVLFLDAMTPLGFAVWTGHVFAVLLTLWVERRHAHYMVAGVATVLIIAGYFLSPPGLRVDVAIVNRFVGVGLFWTSAWIVARLKVARLDDATRRLGAIVDGSDDAILSVTLSGLVMSWNVGAERIFGYSADEMVGRSVDRLLLEKDRSAGSWLYPALRGEGTIQSYDAVRIGKDGRRIDVSITMSPLKDGTGRIVGVSKIMRDVGERKRSQLLLRKTLDELEKTVQERTTELSQANRSLQELSSRLMQVQEEERRQLARDLHDEVGQLLTALKIDLQNAQHHWDDQSSVGTLTDSLGLVDRLLTQVRTLALDLRPSILDDLGLVPALRWYANRQAQRNGWTLQLHVEEGLGRLLPMIEVACFRVVQEALTNVAKYAGAKTIELVLRRQAEEVILIIHDDGVGFDVAAARQRAQEGGSMGLFGMQERVRLAGGLLSIVSEPGRGASLELRFPFVDGAVATSEVLGKANLP